MSHCYRGSLATEGTSQSSYTSQKSPTSSLHCNAKYHGDSIIDENRDVPYPQTDPKTKPIYRMSFAHLRLGHD